MLPQTAKVRDTWPAAAAFAVNGGLYGGLLSRYAELADGFDAGPAEFGVILTAGALGGLGGSILGPLVMRSWRIGLATGVAGVAYSLLSTSLAFAPGPVFAALLFFVVGIADGGHDVSMNALTVRFQQQLGVAIMGRAHAIWSLALAVGAAIGAVAAALSVSPVVHLTTMGALCALLQLIAARRLRSSHLDVQRATPSAEPRAGRSVRHAPSALRGSSILAIAITAIAASYIEGPAQDWSAILLSDVFDASTGVAATAPYALSVGLVVARLSTDTLRRRLDPGALAGIAAGVVAVAGLVGYAAAHVGSPAWSALVLFAAIGLGTGPIYPMLFDTADALSSRYGLRVIATSGMISACSRIGAITAPTLVGQLAHVSGVSVIFVIIATAGAAIALSLPSVSKDSASSKS